MVTTYIVVILLLKDYHALPSCQTKHQWLNGSCKYFISARKFQGRTSLKKMLVYSHFFLYAMTQYYPAAQFRQSVATSQVEVCSTCSKVRVNRRQNEHSHCQLYDDHRWHWQESASEVQVPPLLVLSLSVLHSAPYFPGRLQV